MPFPEFHCRQNLYHLLHDFGIVVWKGEKEFRHNKFHDLLTADVVIGSRHFPDYFTRRSQAFVLERKRRIHLSISLSVQLLTGSVLLKQIKNVRWTTAPRNNIFQKISIYKIAWISTAICRHLPDHYAKEWQSRIPTGLKHHVSNAFNRSQKRRLLP